MTLKFLFNLSGDVKVRDSKDVRLNFSELQFLISLALKEVKKEKTVLFNPLTTYFLKGIKLLPSIVYYEIKV